MTQSKMFTLLGLEINRHRAQAKLFTEPEIAAGHGDIAEALEQAVALLKGQEKVQPKRVVVHKCSRYRLRKGRRSRQNDSKTL